MAGTSRIRVLAASALVVWALVGVADVARACIPYTVDYPGQPGLPTTYNSGCVPDLSGGEEPGVYLFRDAEGHRAPCWGFRLEGGYHFTCIFRSPVNLVPGDGGPGVVPIPPTGWCAATSVFFDPQAPWIYVAWCIPTGEPGTPGEPPRLYILEDNENNPAPCVGVRILDGFAFVCNLRQPI